MEKKGKWIPEAVTVMEPVPVSMAEIAIATPPPPEYQQRITDSLLNRIAQQLRRHGNAAWKLGVQFGRVAPTIVHVAGERDAELIVTGLGRHGKLARLFGAETAARVVRLSSVPVLAVNAGARGAPHVAVVAMDFGKSSLQAAREALRVIEPPGRLHLVHVRWAFEGHPLRDADWERTYSDGVELNLDRLENEMEQRDGIEISSEMLRGSVIETLLSVAQKLRADLIAAGSHNQNFVDRVLIGSTPAHLLRAATCSVLIAPPAESRVGR
jgi:nucleotide-binding universal stress UspA family protein